MGDYRTYENVVALRAVQTTDFMTADWAPLPHELLAKVSSRIINEVRGINRVTYDISSKPPATIEWEGFDEGDRGDGSGCGNEGDEACGAARAARGDKRRRRPGPCVGIRRDRAGVALDLGRSPRPRSDADDSRARAGRSGYRRRLWHDRPVGGTARIRPHRL